MLAGKLKFRFNRTTLNKQSSIVHLKHRGAGCRHVCKRFAVRHAPCSDGPSDTVQDNMTAWHGTLVWHQLMQQSLQDLSSMQDSIMCMAASQQPQRQLNTQKALPQLTEFYGAWQQLSSMAGSLAVLEQHDETSKTAACLLGQASYLEQQLCEDRLVYNMLKNSDTAQLQPLSTSHAPAASGCMGSGDWAHARSMLLLQMQRAGFHPADLLAVSVVLTQDEKRSLVENLRYQEQALIARCQRLLYGNSASSEVDVTQQELDSDPVLFRAAQLQQMDQGVQQQPCKHEQSQDDDTLQTLADTTVHLDLPTSAFLLQHHPDRALRQQVYEMGIEARCVKVLELAGDLSVIRQKISRFFGVGSYAQLSHAGTLAGSSETTLATLESMVSVLRPAAQQQILMLQQQLGRPDIQPWDLDQVSADILPGASTTAPALQLERLLAGLSTMLKDIMGVWLDTVQAHHDGSPPLDSAASCLEALLQEYVAGIESTGAASDVVKDGAPYASNVQVYSVHHEDWGNVGMLVVHPSAGCGTRYISMGSASHPPIVLVGLQWPKYNPQPGLPALIGELLHEMGHALQFLLCYRHASTVNAPLEAHGPESQHVGGSPRWLLSPLQLPLELSELPSTLLELLCAQPEAMQRLLSAAAAATGCQDDSSGQTTPLGNQAQESHWAHVTAERIAKHHQHIVFGPMTLLIQALTATLDQLLLSSAAGRDAVALWADLCRTTLPQRFGPMFTVHQAQSLQRYLELRGGGYAYLSAWSLATSAWLHHGLQQDPCSPRAWRALRQLVYEQGNGVRQNLTPWLSAVSGGAASVCEDRTQSQRSGGGEPGLVTWGPGVLLTTRAEQLSVCMGSGLKI